MNKVTLAALALVALGCGNSLCPTDGSASLFCLDGRPPSPSGTGGGTTDAVPCGPTPCDDGNGGALQDVGEACAGDDMVPPPPGGYACCHGLSCEGTRASTPGTCVRPTASAGETCPVVWLYQCDGYYQAKNGEPLTYTGSFTGPPPSEVTRHGYSLATWMKTKFWALYATLVRDGTKFTLLAAKNCRDVGPYPGP